MLYDGLLCIGAVVWLLYLVGCFGIIMLVVVFCLFLFGDVVVAVCGVLFACCAFVDWIVVCVFASWLWYLVCLFVTRCLC